MVSLLAYATLYHWYKLPASRVIRVLFLLSTSFLVFQGVQLHSFPRIPLFFLSSFLIGEVIYRYKIRIAQPKLPVVNNKKNVYESFTLQSLDSFFFAHSMKEVIKQLLTKKHIQFIFTKAHINVNELPVMEIGKEQIAKKAFEVVLDLHGDFITRMDLFVAYLLLIEPQTRLLFGKHVKEEELLHILYWARIDFPEEEHPIPKRVVFLGEGFADNWTEGWTLETKRFIVDVTSQVMDKMPVLLGRKKEFQELVDILSKTTRNSALLIGEAGTGKTSLVDALAFNSYIGALPDKLSHKHVYQLQVGQLVAGIRDAGELETRLESILEELDHSGNIILFVPELEHMVGSSSFQVDLSGSLIPYLRQSKLPIVATVEPGEYKTYIEPLRSFAEMFEQIKIEEPDREEAIQMLLERANDIEEQNHVTLTYKAVVSSVDLAHRFMQDRALPGSAVTLLTSVASTASIAKQKIVDEAEIIAKIEQQTKVAIATPGEKEKGLLLHLEEELHKRVIGQEEAVQAISQAIRRVRAGLANPTRPISFLFLGPTGVGKTETAKALATVYFGGEDKTIRLDMSEYTGFDAVNRLIGSSSGQRGELTEKVYEHPFSLVLLDEFEKAQTEVLDLFLQVLDDGRLTDNHGKRVSFSNTIIIATSNAGALYIQDQLNRNAKIDSTFQQGLLRELEQEHIFKPELLNRFDGIIVFRSLTQSDIEEIAKLYITKVQKQLEVQDIHITFSSALIQQVAKEGYDPEFGARPLRRFIQDKVEDPISRFMLEGKIQRGDKITLSLDSSNTLQLLS